VLVVPAIDIRGGKCVRLYQGDYGRETVFGDDPAAMALRWAREGARAIHLVDLDGARSGHTENRQAVVAILETIRGFERGQTDGTRIMTDLGGGIRDLAAVREWLSAGLDRVILGTAAVEDPDLVSRAAEHFPGRVWVGIDARGGRVAVSGWTAASDVDAVELARQVEGRGAAGIIYTDIDRDGTGRGVNVPATAALADCLSIPVYASGGVRTASDVAELRKAAGRGIEGVIVGRALYDGAVTLSELLEAAR